MIATVAELDTKLEDVRQQIEGVEAEIAQATENLTDALAAGKSTAKLESSLASLKARHDGLQALISRLEGQRSDIASQQTQDAMKSAFEQLHDTYEALQPLNDRRAALQAELVALEAQRKPLVDLTINLNAHLGDLQRELVSNHAWEWEAVTDLQKQIKTSLGLE